MAKACLLTWFALALTVRMASTCLQCWPDAVEYFSYDVHLLVKDADTSDKLEKLFLGRSDNQPYYGGNFLEREHMEREAGELFLRLEKLIKKNAKDRDLLMKEAELEKKHFDKKVEEASNTFVEEICSLSCGKSRYKPYKVAQCTSCQVLTVPCLAHVVCAGPNVIAAVVVTILVVLVGIGGAATYYYRKKIKGQDEGEEREREASKKESYSESTDTSEWSDDSPQSVSKYYNMKPQSPNPYEDVTESPQIYEDVEPTSHYENFPPPSLNIPGPPGSPPPDIPSPPPFNIPSPPPFNIPSPPPFNIPSPPPQYIPSPPPLNFQRRSKPPPFKSPSASKPQPFKIPTPPKFSSYNQPSSPLYLPSLPAVY